MCYNRHRSPPPDGFRQRVSGNTLAGPNGTNSNGMSFLGSGICSAGVGPVTIGIHAQPYNWHITGVNNNGDGSLTYYYDWLSTSGSKADLISCYIHEWVTYPGTIGTAAFPLDYTMPIPFSGALPNPTVLPGTGVNGEPATNPQGTDHQGMPPLILFPHISGGFTATQEYEFDDTLTGETNTLVPGPDSGPLSIARSVYSSGGILWFYSLTKSGYTVTQPI